MWFNILKNPILEGDDIPNIADRRYTLASNMANHKQYAGGIVWESKDMEARGYAFKWVSEDIPYWLITVFEVLDKGKGKGEEYLKEFISDLKAKEPISIWVVTVLEDSSSFWERMLQIGIIDGQTKYYFPNDDE